MTKSTAGTSGTTNTARTIDKKIVVRETKKSSITLGWVLLSLVIAYGWFYIESNLSQGSLSFWVGLGAPLVIVAAIVALYLASTDKTSNIAGPIITYGTFVGLLVIIALLFVNKVFETISFGIFLWGVVDFLIIVGLIASWRIHAGIINKFNN
jgi:hypothetical protein